MDLTLPELSRSLGVERRKVQLRMDWLRDAELVVTDRCGRYLCYRLSPSKRTLLGQVFHTYKDSLEWSATLQVDQQRARSCARLDP